MELRYSFVVLFLVASVTAAPLKNNLVRFYPISRAQYDAILKMTAGQPIISEGRLINSSFRTLNNLRTAISSDISSGWHQLLNITGLRPIDYKATQHKVDGYPLCVIKTNDIDDERVGEVDANLQQGRNNDDDYDEEEYAARNEENVDYENNSSRPVVNCIVVVKKPEESETPNTQLKQKEPTNEPNTAENQAQRRFRRPAYRSPYFYPPYAYPVYPFYGYPYYPEARYSMTQSTHKSAPPRVKYVNYARSAGKDTISAEPPKPKMEDKSTGRSGYQTSYYPSYYGGYNGYGGYSNYHQTYPYSAGYGGCQNSYNPYGSSYYGGGYFRRSNDEDGDDDSDVSGEVAGEIGGGDFD